MIEQGIAGLLVVVIVVLAMLLIANVITAEQAVSAIVRAMAVVVLSLFVVCEIRNFVSVVLLPWLGHAVPILASVAKIVLGIAFLLAVTVFAMHRVTLKTKTSRKKHGGEL